MRGVPTIQCIGKGDSAVLPAASEELASLFDGAAVRRHAKGHMFPVSSGDVDAYADLARKSRLSLEASEEEGETWDKGCVGGEEVDEEFEALEAIFGEDNEIAIEGSKCRVRLVGRSDAEVHFAFPPGYPQVPLR